jgi:hypothetical protein
MSTSRSMIMMIRIPQFVNSTLVKKKIHTQDSTRVLTTLPPKTPYVLLTKSTLLPTKSILSTLLLLPPCSMPLSILNFILPTLMLILNHQCTRKVVQMSFRNHIPMTFDLTDQVQLPTRIMMKRFNEVLWNAAR